MALADALPAQSQLHGMLLLTCIVALGVLGILIMVGLAIARQRHWQRLKSEHKRHHENPPVDPWEEAGRRLDVPEEAEETADNDEFRP